MKQIQCLKRIISDLKTKLKTGIIRNEKCADKWKLVKTKFKNNTHKAPASLMSPKKIFVSKFVNRFNNVIVTEVNQIEILKS